MKHLITFLVSLFLLSTAPSLTAAGVVLTKKTPTDSEEYWNPIEFGSIENFPTSVVITSKGTKQTSTIPRHQIGEVIEFVDFNATSIVSEDGLSKIKAARDSVAKHASKCKQAAGILAAVVQNYDQVLSQYADGNVLVAGRWINKHDYAAKLKADALASTAGSIPEVIAGAKTFKNVRVTKVVDDRISIMHEGGIASFNSGDLSDETRLRMETAFPKYFQKTQQTPANENAPASKGTEKTAFVDSPPQMQIGSGTLPPSPLETNALKPQTLQNQQDAIAAAFQLRAVAPLDKTILEKEKSTIIEAVESIGKRVAATKYNGSLNIRLSFDPLIGKMTIGDQLASILNNRTYLFLFGDLDPERIYADSFTQDGKVIYYTEAHTINDANSVRVFSGTENGTEYSVVLFASDEVDAKKNAKAMQFLAAIYKTSDKALPSDPLVKLNLLLNKYGNGVTKVSLNNDELVFESIWGDGKPGADSTIQKINLTQLDPEKFTFKDTGEKHSYVELICSTGNLARINHIVRGAEKSTTADGVAFRALNSMDARQILDIVVDLCVKAGWKKPRF